MSERQQLDKEWTRWAVDKKEGDEAPDVLPTAFQAFKEYAEKRVSELKEQSNTETATLHQTLETSLGDIVADLKKISKGDCEGVGGSWCSATDEETEGEDLETLYQNKLKTLKVSATIASSARP